MNFFLYIFLKLNLNKKKFNNHNVVKKKKFYVLLYYPQRNEY
jgi:hypothetical protein